MRKSLGLTFTGVMFAASVLAGSQSVTPHTFGVNHKRALIVAIGQYPKSTGWGPISSINDIGLIRASLEQQQFGSIAVLPESQSTRAGILKAIDETLILPAGKGDVVVFHYSGHGQQLPDDDGDEPDGYDEAIVPVDAPATNKGGYRGGQHIRDDEIARKLRELRKKVGPTGNVVAIFDSCFSGAITRGALAVRGGPPLGEPAQMQRPSAPEASGLFESSTSRGTQAEPTSDLAPYVVISAARFDELNYEMRSPSGQVVGPLSYAMSSSLAQVSEGATYRSLFESIQDVMQKRVRNQPQIEGDLDTVIFNGRLVPQRPFIAIGSIIDGRTLSLAGGTLLGLERGTTVEIHRAGATSASESTRLATGSIMSSTPTTARVALDAPVPLGSLQNGRAFVTSYAFGDLRLRAQLVALDAQTDVEVGAALNRIAAIETVTERPDLIVREDPARRDLTIVDADTGTTIGLPMPINRDVGRIVASRLEDIARNRYLRRLTLSSPGLKAGLEIVPVTVDACVDPSRPTEDSCTVTPLDLHPFVTPGHGLSFPVGTYFKLRVTPAARAAYLAVIDLAPDGTIGVLVPDNPTRQQTTAPGGPVLAEGLWQFTDPTGNEVFMLVATEQFVDFSPFASVEPGTARGAPERRAMGAFAPLFDDAAVRTRSKRVVPLGGVATSMLSVTVRPR